MRKNEIEVVHVYGFFGTRKSVCVEWRRKKCDGVRENDEEQSNGKILKSEILLFHAREGIE